MAAMVRRVPYTAKQHQQLAFRKAPPTSDLRMRDLYIGQTPL